MDKFPKDVRLVDEDYSFYQEQARELDRNKHKGAIYLAGFVLSVVALAILLMVA